MRKFIKTLLSNNATMYYFTKWTEIRLNLLMRRVHDDDYLFFKNFSYINDGLFIGIGGNFGQSAISFSVVNRNINILSFEPNRALEGNLRAASRVLGNRQEYRMFGIGKKNARVM